MAAAKPAAQVTPAGTAAYAWTTKPDAKFAKGDPSQAKYKITLKLPKAGDEFATKAQVAEFVAMVRQAHKDAGGSARVKCPIKDGDKKVVVDEDENEKPDEAFAGHWYVQFSSKYPPKMVDTKKQPLPSNIFVASGDIVKVSFSMGTYEDGVSMRLGAIMLKDKRNFGSDGGADAFGDDEDGFVAESADDTTTDVTDDDVDY